MNEYFERKPLNGQILEKLHMNLVAARFKIIEVLSLLKADFIMAKHV